MGSLEVEYLEYPVPPPGYVYCLCGCGELMFITNEWGVERGYIPGHNSKGENNPWFISMSGRICSKCGSTKTHNRIQKMGPRPKWYRDGDIRLMCRTCHDKLYWQSSEIKERRNLRQKYRYNHDPEYRNRRLQNRKEYIQKPEVKEHFKLYMRKYLRRKRNTPPERYRV